jgi:alpha-1,2-mannosyltransferase
VSVSLFGVIPAVTIVVLFWVAAVDDSIAFDFGPVHRAADSILAGETPYPGPADPLTADAGPYVYPPLPALLAISLSWLPFDAAGVVVMAVLLLAVLATLRVLGVDDWRCYGVALLWPPVLSAIQTGNVTLLLGLAAAVVWRLRHDAVTSGVLTGLTLAVKFFLWPLCVWFAATRRFSAAAIALAAGTALLIASWAVIDFAGMTDYPDLLRRLEDTVGADSYTLYIVGLDIGLPPPAARALWIGAGFAVLAASIFQARRGEERVAFALAIVAALLLTPIVWLHYLALLLVVVALGQTRLGVVWFLPLALVLTPGSGQPTPFETAWTLAVAASVVAVSLFQLRGSTARNSTAAIAAIASP